MRTPIASELMRLLCVLVMKFALDMKMLETYEQQIKDSDMIFTQITNGNFDDYQQAESAIVVLYVQDMTISRAGISRALGRIKKYYEWK